MSTSPAPPDRTPLLKIGAVARHAGVSPDAIRYYERLGLVEPAGRSSGGYRLFSPAVHERLTFIRKGQALGLTLEEVGEVLEFSDTGTAPCRHRCGRRSPSGWRRWTAGSGGRRRHLWHHRERENATIQRGET